MGFERIEVWDEGARLAHWSRADSGSTAHLVLPGFLYARPVRRALAAAATGLVHLVIIWLLLNKLDSGREDRPSAGAAGSMKLFTLLQPEDVATSTAVVAPPAPVATNQSQVDTTATSDAPQPEWRIARVVVQIETRRAPPLSANVSQTQTMNGTGATSGALGRQSPNSQSVYDPYAGAAVIDRRSAFLPSVEKGGGRAGSTDNAREMGRALGPLPDRANLRERIDGAMLSKLIQDLRAENLKFPDLVAVQLLVSSDGQILEAEVRDRPGTAQARERLRSRLLGLRLYSSLGALGPAEKAMLTLDLR